ncbi:hypothetical protein MMC34_005765 [Xylographa carneopallida]|nr:hypothetical protein [Xylographa carneopallida]
MHYSKIFLITILTSATTITAINPAQYRAIQARAYLDHLHARDPAASASADLYDDVELYARDLFDAAYLTTELDARGLPTRKSPSRQGTGVADKGDGTPNQPASSGNLKKASTGGTQQPDRGTCGEHSVANPNFLVCDTAHGTCHTCSGKHVGATCYCHKSDYV